VAKPIAKIDGVALRPGVSKNGRLYTREVIAGAVTRAQRRLAEGGPPLTMLTHHGAEDDSTRIAGRITALRLGDDGEALYDALLADTDGGRTILELVDPDDGGAFLEGVSIRGYWLDELRRVEHDGQTVETADTLELDGLDFTKTPGVLGARVNNVTRVGRAAAPRESGGRTPIYESAEARVQDQPTLVDSEALEQEVARRAAAGETRDLVYADPGYQADQAKRFPLDTRAGALAAWEALSTRETALEYTSKQLKRARGRTRRELDRHGVTVTTEGHLRTAGPVTEAAVREFWPVPAGERAEGGFEVCLYVGPLRVAVSSYAVDAHDLDRITRVAATAAADCLAAVSADPDAPTPGTSIEGGGKPAFLDDDEDDDEDGPDDDAKESGAAQAEDPDADGTAVESTTQAAPAADTLKEPAVADTPTQTAAAAAAAAETSEQRVERLVAERFAAAQEKATEDAQIEKLVAERLAAAQAPLETEEQRVERLVAEKLAAAPAAQETTDQRIQRLVAARVTEAIQGHVEKNGAPTRTGLVPGAGDAAAEAAGYPTDWPRRADGEPKAVHELTESERDRHTRPLLERHVMGSRSVFVTGTNPA
jgi:hypothetical protein